MANENLRLKALKEKDRIIIVGGLIDFQINGNQSIKQTTKYFLKKYDVIYLSAMPIKRTGLDKDYLVNESGFKIYRLPKFLLLPYYIFKYFLNFFKSNKMKNKSSTNSYKKFNEIVDYFDNTNKIGFLVYRTLQFLYVFFEFFRLSYFILKINPKFVYGVESYGGLAASLICKFFKIKVVKRFQGTPLIIKDNQIYNNKYLNSFISPYTVNKKNDLVVMANDGTKGDEVLNFLNISRHNYCFMINGFNTDNLKDIADFNFGSGKHIVMLSKLKIWKRVDRGLYLLSSLIKYDDNIYLHIIGDGEMRYDLEILANNLNINKNVIFHGSLSNREALSYLKSSDLFWSFYDITNLGNPLLEASFFGIPIQTLYESSMSKITPAEIMYGLEDFDKIVSDAKKILKYDSYNFKHRQFSFKLKSNIVNWEDRVQMEINWIEENL